LNTNEIPESKSKGYSHRPVITNETYTGREASRHRNFFMTSVICQISDIQVFAGFLGFPGFRKPGNLETSKLKLTNYTVQHLVINRLLMKENPY
jgi:hypothetical protein